MIIIVGGQGPGNSQLTSAARRRTRSLLGAASVISVALGLCVGFVATDALAASSHHKQTQAADAAATSSGYAGTSNRATPGIVPVRATDGEACDLPSSPCPNDLRISN